MEIKNNVIVSLDKKDKNLVVPKNAVGVEYPVSDTSAIRIEEILSRSPAQG